MRPLIPIVLFAACGPQLPVECSVDSQCGLGFRCQTNQCVSAPTSPPPYTPPAPQSSNDTCETATVATVGVARGTTRGAKRDYSPVNCFPEGATAPMGGEVVFRFRLPAYSDLKFGVRSLSPEFTPALYLAGGAPTCGQAINEKQCGSALVGQTGSETPEIYLIVASASSIEGDFELSIEATPRQQSNQGGGSAGGGASGGSSGPGGGSSGGAAQPAVTARAVWESQSDVRELSQRVRDYHLEVIRAWSTTARRVSGSNSLVFFGTLTETATDVFQYAPTPADRLQVNRRDGFQFSFTVQSVVGNLASLQFPAADESISFVFRHPRGSLTGRVSQRGSSAASATREWNFQGVSWTSQNDTEVSTMSIQHSSTVSLPAAALRVETGTLTNSRRNIRWSFNDDSWNCSTCTPTLGSKFTPRVTTTVGARTFVLDYEYEFGTTPNAAIGRHLWNGTVKEGGQVVGRLSRVLVSGTTYALSMSIGADSHNALVVQSQP